MVTPWSPRTSALLFLLLGPSEFMLCPEIAVLAPVVLFAFQPRKEGGSEKGREDIEDGRQRRFPEAAIQLF